MTRRTRMILIRAAVVVFLLYAVVNVVNLRTQIKSKMARTELGYAEPGERIFVDTSSR